PRVVPYMAVVDFVGPPLDFYYRFFGTKMVEFSGVELTGKTYYADGVTEYGFVNAQQFPRMIEMRRPLVIEARWMSMRGLRVATQTIRLSLSEDGETITGGAAVNEYRLLDSY
ncbi:MAG: hypothetical protein VW405_08340, partial [Rhodospirillaceae bacterium]